MLDNNPVLKERLMAIGAFAGIGIFAVAAIDVMVTGGFDFGPGRAPYDREQPSPYVRVVDAANYVSDRFRSIAWNDPLGLNAPDTSASEERLAGADDGTALVDATGEADESSGDDLNQQIAALYAESEVETPAYEDAPALDAEEPFAEERNDEPAYEGGYLGDEGKGS